jgi:hypothetical protein
MRTTCEVGQQQRIRRRRFQRILTTTTTRNTINVLKRNSSITSVPLRQSLLRRQQQRRPCQSSTTLTWIPFLLLLLLSYSFDFSCHAKQHRHYNDVDGMAIGGRMTVLYDTSNNNNNKDVVIMGVVEVNESIFVSFNDQEKGSIIKLNKDLLHQDQPHATTTINASFSLQTGETFGQGLHIYPSGGIITTVSEGRRIGIHVLNADTLDIRFQGQVNSPTSGNGDGFACMVVAPTSGRILLSNQYFDDTATTTSSATTIVEEKTTLTVFNNKGQVEFSIMDSSNQTSSNVIQNCPVLFPTNDTLAYYVTGPLTGDDHTSKGGVVTKLSLDEKTIVSISDPFTDSIVRGPAINPMDGILYLSTFQDKSSYLDQYQADSLQHVARIALPDNNAVLVSTIANPTVSPDGTLLYLFGREAIVAIRLQTREVAFQVPVTSLSAQLPPLLTKDGRKWIYVEPILKQPQQQKTTGGYKVIILNAVSGSAIREFVLKEAQTIVHVHLNAVNDQIYIAYTCSNSSSGGGGGGSQVMAIDLAIDQQQEERTHAKHHEPWSAVFVELILYPTILILTLANQIRRMYRSLPTATAVGGSSDSSSYGVYQPIHKETELTDLNAEYGEVDGANDDDGGVGDQLL